MVDALYRIRPLRDALERLVELREMPGVGVDVGGELGVADPVGQAAADVIDVDGWILCGR
ncbi:MAG TPA: hypothetical protein VIV14_00615 [Gammaproteobacteria bacterium]